jgi:hypothetical protein
MPAAAVSLAMFLINETTKEIYTLPAEADGKLSWAKPCAPFKTTITASTFSSATLDQMCTSLAQSLLPRISGVLKTTWSNELMRTNGTTIYNLQSAPVLRSDAQLWPPEIPFSLTGLTAVNGMNIVVGVKIPEKTPATLERIDVWSNLDGKFTRVYWSRAINDPTYRADLPRITQWIGGQIQRAWKSSPTPAATETVGKISLLVDKKISEKDLTTIENVVRSSVKGASASALWPIEVRKTGILYQTLLDKSKQSEIAKKLIRELPAYRVQKNSEDSADLSLMLTLPQ